MTEALKEIAKFAVEKGPKIGHYCLEQKLAKVGVCNVFLAVIVVSELAK